MAEILRHKHKTPEPIAAYEKNASGTAVIYNTTVIQTAEVPVDSGTVNAGTIVVGGGEDLNAKHEEKKAGFLDHIKKYNEPGGKDVIIFDNVRGAMYSLMPPLRIRVNALCTTHSGLRFQWRSWSIW